MTTIAADFFQQSTPASFSFARENRATSAINEALANIATRTASTLQSRTISVLGRMAQQYTQPGWDGYDAAPIDRAVYERASAFLQALPLTLEAPDLVPEADGQIAIEWFIGPKWTFSVSLSARGPLHYAGLFGPDDEVHGVKTFDGRTIPEELLGYIKKLFANAAASRAA